jgi:hypothetical protein
MIKSTNKTREIEAIPITQLIVFLTPLLAIIVYLLSIGSIFLPL